MELNQIKYFILTAKLLNMSKAAQALNIAQPSLSKSIAGLERELGTQLFDRSGKKLILNERGKSFLKGAEASVEELENAVAAAKWRLSDFTLNIGMFCPSGKLIKCIGEFLTNNQELAFNINQLHGDLAHIDTNEYDLLLYPMNQMFKRYRGVFAYTEKYLLAVNKKSPLSSLPIVNLSELDDQRFIFIKYGDKEYDDIYHICPPAVQKRKNISFCNSYEIQRLMISTNQGIGFVPEESADAYKRDENIVFIPIEDNGFQRKIFIGFKREKHLSEFGRNFAAFVSKYFGLDGEENGFI